MFLFEYFNWFDAAILTALAVVIVMGLTSHGPVR